MSNLESSIAALAARILTHSETIQTEEAIKTSVVLPFLQALGYDVFNPGEVIPEFTADAPGKRGEKVDYAVKKDGEMLLLIECKGLSTQLNEKHLAQLFRYFTVTNTRFAMLTNGREYRFYTDLDQTNRMDTKPFFVIDLLDYTSGAIVELAKFSRSEFDVEAILAQAERLKYVSATKRLLSTWFDSPPEAFTKLVTSEIYDGRQTAEIRKSMSRVIVAAVKDIVRDRLQTRISTALDDSEVLNSASEAELEHSDIETTQEEVEGWLLVKTLLRGEVEASRINIRDAKTYCAILLDNNNRKPLARLHFNGRAKFVGLFDGDKEDRVKVNNLDDMLDLQDRLLATAKKYP